MEEISTGVLRDIVKDQEHLGKRTISVSTLLARLQLTALVDPAELERLRNIELLVRKIVADERWLVRGPIYSDAEALQRLLSK